MPKSRRMRSRRGGLSLPSFSLPWGAKSSEVNTNVESSNGVVSSPENKSTNSGFFGMFKSNPQVQQTNLSQQVNPLQGTNLSQQANPLQGTEKKSVLAPTGGRSRRRRRQSRRRSSRFRQRR